MVKNRYVEKHIIRKGHKFFEECDSVAFKSKNLYNSANYIIRQSFIADDGKYLNYYHIDKLLNSSDNTDYRALPAKVSKGTLKQLHTNWLSFFAAVKEYKKIPNKFNGQPKLPKYKKSGDGVNGYKNRFKVTYDKQAISKKVLKKEKLIKLSGTNIKLKSKNVKCYEDICEVRIIVNYGYYVIEIVYNKPKTDVKCNNNRYASIDIGLNNLATIATNTSDVKPYIVNGKPLKSINQFYNKKKSKLQSTLKKGMCTSNKIEKLTSKRKFKVDDYLHKASRYIVNQLVSDNINTLIVGKNKEWKQDINIGKRNNQNFVNIPFARFINMLSYKCELAGITIILTEESYTSKCSFLDNELICKHINGYKGKRVKRGLYKSAIGRFINADLNGSYNIMKKVVSNAFADGIEGVAVHPIKIRLF